MANLLKRKPMNLLLAEAHETGEHSLKRTLGPFSAHRAGQSAPSSARASSCCRDWARTMPGPGLMLSFVLSGLGCAFAGLCYAEFAAMIPLAGSAYTYAYATLGELFAWIIGWDLTLEYAMGASTVSSGWSNHFIELLNIFHIKMPLWLAYDHWTGFVRPQKTWSRGRWRRHRIRHSSPARRPSSTKSSALMTAQSPELLQRAHDSAGRADSCFGVEIGFNLPAFIIALVITAILVIGHQGERALQRDHRRDQGWRLCCS